MRYILTILTISLLLNANYLEVGERVVDSKTNLQWQNDNQVNSIQKSWKEAINFCENLELDGYKDWRLPNIVELSSIIDVTKPQPVIAEIFKNRAGDFWSSTTKAQDSTVAWIVIFNYGIEYFKDKKDKYFVRCVRGGI